MNIVLKDVYLVCLLKSAMNVNYLTSLLQTVLAKIVETDVIIAMVKVVLNV